MRPPTAPKTKFSPCLLSFLLLLICICIEKLVIWRNESVSWQKSIAGINECFSRVLSPTPLCGAPKKQLSPRDLGNGELRRATRPHWPHSEPLEGILLCHKLFPESLPERTGRTKVRRLAWECRRNPIIKDTKIKLTSTKYLYRFIYYLSSLWD